MTGLPDRIVSLTDFSETSNNAAKRAAELALIMKRPMTLLHISESTAIPSLADASLRNQLMEEELEIKGEKLQQVADELTEIYSNLALNIRIIADPVFDTGIERFLTEMPASLLVLGKKHRTTLEKIFIGSNIKRLLRNGHFTVPLLLVPPQLDRFELKHLILAVNLREKMAEIGFSFLEKLIANYGVTLGVVYSQGKDGLSEKEVDAKLKEILPKAMSEKIQSITLVGDKEDIPTTPYVDELPTDIVVAFPGKKGLFESLVKGSFSEYLADNYEKPILLIPQP
ncbi:universal stress protein [Lunatibacter salilacus]|uniref:universal stress protein n=1 Tax=Lunatibacter salilacus TaxID=2483804 RepID=UPI00131E0546|nr:universal stress protein [Lunatibacter salilacus]